MDFDNSEIMQDVPASWTYMNTHGAVTRTKDDRSKNQDQLMLQFQ
jgi:hypothetical protein